MSALFTWIEPILAPILEFVLTIGPLISHGWKILVRGLQTRPVRWLFGKSLGEELSVCVPIYDPLSYDDSSTATAPQTKVNKTYTPITGGSPSFTEKSLYCSVIAEPDYRAAEALNKLFWDAGLSSGKIIGDKERPESVSPAVFIGAPTINAQLNALFTEVFSDVLTIEPCITGNLPSFTFPSDHSPRLYVTKDDAVGVVARWQTRSASKDYKTCVFGCRAEITLETVKWLCANDYAVIKELWKISKNKKNQGDSRLLAACAFDLRGGIIVNKQYVYTIGEGWRKISLA